MKRVLIYLSLCVAVAICETECINENVAECAEKKLINLIEEVDQRPSVDLLDGLVTVDQTNEARIRGTGSPRSSQEGVVDRIFRYLTEHQVTVKFPVETAKSLVSEMRSSKLKKIIVPALLLLKLKAAIIIPAVLSAIALVAFKGLGAGLVALFLSATTAFKSLVEGQGSKKVSFEVVPPHWNRAGYAPSAPQAAYVHEWPIGPYQTLP